MTNKSKLVSITHKRQVTIPKEFFNRLDMAAGKARCYIQNGKIVIEPINTMSFWEFSSDILQELVAQGYSGERLVSEFNKRKDLVKEGLAAIVMEAAEQIKSGEGKDVDQVFQEIFNSMEETRE